MLPFRSRRSSTLLMSNLAYFASRTPSATFSKSQKSAMFTLSLDTVISAPWILFIPHYPICRARAAARGALPAPGLKFGRSRNSILFTGATHAYRSSRSRHGALKKRSQPDGNRAGAAVLVRLRRCGRAGRRAQRPSGRARHRVRPAPARSGHLLDRLRRPQFPAFARGSVRVAVALFRGGGRGRGQLLPGGRPGRAQLGVRRTDSRFDLGHAAPADDRRCLGAARAPFRRCRDRRGYRARQPALHAPRRRRAAGADPVASERRYREEAPALGASAGRRPAVGLLLDAHSSEDFDFLRYYFQFTP